MRWLNAFSDHAYALLRIAAGFMFSVHGAQKILGVLGDAAQRPEPWSQLWIGGIIELFGGLAVMVGLMTRPAAFLCSGTMAVAYFQFHWKFRLGPEFFPAVNKGELAALYSLLFLFIACRGVGKWGFDAADS